MHFFISTFILCASTILSCSPKYRRNKTLNHNHLSPRLYIMIRNVCISLPSIIWVIFLNSEAAIREKRGKKQEVISSTLTDADLASWSKKKFVFQIWQIILTKTQSLNFFLKHPRAQIPIRRRKACPYYVAIFPLAKMEKV